MTPAPPPGFKLISSEPAAAPPPPAGFELIQPEAPDPIHAKPTSLSELPSAEHFAASHQKAVQDFHSVADAAARPDSAMWAANPIGMATLAQGRNVEQNKPILPLSKLAPDQPTSAAGGVAKGVANVAEGLTTPANVAIGLGAGVGGMVAKVGPLLSRGLSAYFSGMMLRDAVEKVPEIKAAYEKGDAPKVAQLVTEAAANGVLGAAAARHAIKGSPKPGVSRGTAEADIPPPPAGFTMDVGPDTRPDMERLAAPTGVMQESNGTRSMVPPVERRKTPRGQITSPAESAAPAPSGLQGQIKDGRFTLLQEDGKPVTTVPLHDTAAVGDMLSTLKENGHGQAADVLEKASANGAAGENGRIATSQNETSNEVAKQEVADTGADNSTPPENLNGTVKKSAPMSETTQDAPAREVVRNIPREETLRPDVAAGLAEGSTRVNPLGGVETLRKVPIGQIHEAAPTELRPEGNVIYPERVAQYRENPSPVAPELRVDPDGGFSIHDGHHRIAGAIERGDSTVLAWTSKADENGLPKVSKSVYGHDVPVKIPGEQTVYPAKYAVRELSDIEPSHNPHSFEANPAYEIQNDRDYSQAEGAARVVKNASPEVWDNSFHLTESPTAEHGPPVIDERGNVLGGNSRTMSLARVYARNGGHSEAYKRTLAEKAAQFGLDPAAVKGMKQPVLVREVTGPVDAQKAITDFNKGAPAALTPEERAVSDGRRLSDATVKDLAARLGDSAEGSTIAEALRGENGREVINGLVKDGVLTEQERGGYVNDKDELTPEIKARIAKALVGRLFETPAQFRETQPSMRNKLERIAPQVLRVEGRPEWSLTDKTREALALMEDARAHKMKIADVAQQTDLGGKTRGYTPEARQIAQVLEESPRNAEYAFRRYANDEMLSREGQQATMFEPPTREEAFRDAFGEGGPATETPVAPEPVKQSSGAPEPTRAVYPKSKSKKALREFHEQQQKLVGKFYRSYGGGIDKIEAIDVTDNGTTYTVRDETGRTRTHATPISSAYDSAADVEATDTRGRFRKLLSDTRGSFDMGSLFGDSEDIAKANEADANKLTKDRLEAQLNAPVTREEQLKRLRRVAPKDWKDKPQEQADLFGGGSGKSQGGLFGDTEGKFDPKALYEGFKRSAIKTGYATARDFIAPLGSRIEREGNGAGKDLMTLLRRAGDAGEVHAGQMLARVADVQPQKLTRDQRFEVADLLEGRKKSSSDPRVAQVATVFRGITDELAGVATGLGVEIRTKQGKRPFAALEDYMPHVVRPADALRSGPVRRDIIENIVRQKIKPDAAAAGAFVDDWVGYLESGKRQDSILDYMVKSGQATDKAEALANLQKYRSHIERHGSIEYAREVNLPFYDPDPVRVIPFAAASGAKRLAQIGTFGQEHQRINSELLKISNAGGNSDFVRKGVDKILGVVQEGNTPEVRISRLIRGIESFKLGLSAIPNSTQGVFNSMLAADMPSVALGLKDAVTKRGRRLAIESGAAIEPVLAEAQKELGSGRAVDRFLKMTGFSATEQFNRATAANVGARWANKNFDTLKADSTNKAARAHLAELGVDVDHALKAGALDHEDKLMAAKKFSDMTQFRTRPEDLPNFASTPLGKVAFQFKSFAFNQARFLAKQTVGEIKEGRIGPGVRALLVAGTLFPAGGELIRAARNGITGRDQDFDSAIERYFTDLAQAGTLGIFSDVIQSAQSKRLLETIAGPGAADLAHIGEILGAPGDEDDSVPEKLTEKAKALGRYAVQRFGGPLRRVLPDPNE